MDDATPAVSQALPFRSLRSTSSPKMWGAYERYPIADVQSECHVLPPLTARSVTTKGGDRLFEEYRRMNHRDTKSFCSGLVFKISNRSAVKADLSKITRTGVSAVRFAQTDFPDS
jgi:hypothetical protein